MRRAAGKLLSLLGRKKIEDSIAALENMYNSVVKAAGGKKVIISETGWPSAGETVGAAVPSQENANAYFKNAVRWALSKNVDMFYFNAFDEDWKALHEGSRGAYWGVWDKNGKLKYDFLISPKFAGKTEAAEKKPAYVKDLFVASGYMGDTKDITLEGCNTNEKDGGFKITYTARAAQGNGWAGIYWQYPANNWGVYPEGRNFTGARRLTFRARGDRGGEVVEFKAGGITGGYPDSLGEPVTTGEKTLGTEWESFTIELEGRDMSHTIGGFCWVSSRDDNPSGISFYIADIRYEW